MDLWSYRRECLSL